MNRRNSNDPRQQIPKDRKELEERISKISSDRNRLFIFCLFITGARVSEVLCLRRMDFEFSDDGKILRIQLPTLKSKVIDERKIPIMVKNHQELIGELISYINFPDEDDDLVFPFSRSTGWRIVKRYFEGWFPHLFRHYLASHLVDLDGMNEWKLKKFFGWTDTKSASKYTHATSKPLEDLDF